MVMATEGTSAVKWRERSKGSVTKSAFVQLIICCVLSLM